MNSKIVSLINEQINFELFSSYLYFEIENYYSDMSLNGFVNWFHIQAQEELDHAYLLSQYLHNNDEKVELSEIKKPNSKIEAPIDGVELAYSHEKQVSAKIHNIFGVASEEKDFRTTQLLDWFIKEQGEEEKSVKEIVDKMKMFGSDPKTLYLINNELTTRVYAAPSLVL